MGLVTMQLRKSTALAIFVSLCVSQVDVTVPLAAAVETNFTVSIDPVLTYLLSPGFEGNISTNFIDTLTNDSTTAQLFSEARNASFISYDPEFLKIIGESPSLRLIAEREEMFADEAGVWVPEKNQVWFTSATVNNASNISILDLGTSEIFTPNTSIPIITPNGGYYFDGKVYLTGQGTDTVAPCIYAIDPNTYEATVVLNSYFGVRFGGPNDVTWAKQGTKGYMFFTDEPQSYYFSNGQYPVLPDAVWRFDPQERSIVPVVSRADILVPNGIAVSADMKKLYVTDTPPPSYDVNVDAGWATSESPAIFSFDLDDDLFPINKRMLGITRNGISDGLKIDDARRIWTAESEGIVVRNPRGKVIGVFNIEVLGASRIANFALAGDTLVILAMQKLWTVKLAQTLISPERYEL